MRFMIGNCQNNFLITHYCCFIKLVASSPPETFSWSILGEMSSFHRREVQRNRIRQGYSREASLPDKREHVILCSKHLPVGNFACKLLYNLVSISLLSKAEYATWNFTPIQQFQSNYIVFVISFSWLLRIALLNTGY